jgi:hypothetical protein
VIEQDTDRGVAFMSETATGRVQTAAGQARLGQLRRHYHGRFRASVVVVLLLAVLYTLVIPGQFLLGASVEIALLLLAIDLPFAVLAGWLGRWEYRNSNDDVYLFDGGLIHVDRTGVMTPYPWAAVAEVRARRLEVSIQDIPVRNVSAIKVVRDDGARVVLNNRFRGVEPLGTVVQESIASARLPFALGTLCAGGTIDFDGLVVDQRGIRHRGRTLAWPTVVALGAAEGILFTKVTIQTRDRRRPYTRRLFPSQPFPNLFLLVNIARAHNVD